MSLFESLCTRRQCSMGDWRGALREPVVAAGSLAFAMAAPPPAACTLQPRPSIPRTSAPPHKPARTWMDTIPLRISGLLYHRGADAAGPQNHFVCRDSGRAAICRARCAAPVPPQRPPAGITFHRTRRCLSRPFSAEEDSSSSTLSNGRTPQQGPGPCGHAQQLPQHGGCHQPCAFSGCACQRRAGCPPCRGEEGLDRAHPQPRHSFPDLRWLDWRSPQEGAGEAAGGRGAVQIQIPGLGGGEQHTTQAVSQPWQGQAMLQQLDLALWICITIVAVHRGPQGAYTRGGRRGERPAPSHNPIHRPPPQRVLPNLFRRSRSST
jgi:hypothetical protein